MKRENFGPKITREKDTISKMVWLYCRKQHGCTNELCGACRELLDYAELRLTLCPFGEEKPTCEQCHIHCYKKAQAEQMKIVMRFAGPRMIVHHPVAAVRHLFKNKQNKKGKKQV